MWGINRGEVTFFANQFACSYFGKTVDKIIEYAPDGTTKILITNYDYFDETKIKSIEEFDQETGNLKKITTFTLFKSITDYDLKTGKKLKTTNFDLKTSSKKTSIYDYDIETEKISRVTVFRPDGKSVNMVKELNPNTGAVERVINYKKMKKTKTKKLQKTIMKALKKKL